MTAKIVRYPDPDKRSRNPDAVHRDLSDSAIIIVLPIIRIERYGNTFAAYDDVQAAFWNGRKFAKLNDPKPKVRRKTSRRQT